MRYKTVISRFFLFVAPIAVLLVTIPVTPVAADTRQWTEPINLSTTPGPSDSVSTLRDPVSGDILVTWSEDTDTTAERILLRRYDAAARTWLAAEDLSAAPTWAHNRGCVLVRDHSGLVLAVWTRTYQAAEGAPTDGHDLVSRTWDGIAWSAEQIVMHEPSYLPGSLSLVPVETPTRTLLFVGWKYVHQLTAFEEGAWSALGPRMDLEVELAEVMADDEGTLHAAAWGRNSTTWPPPNDQFPDGYYLTSATGEQWSEPVNLSSFDGVASNVNLAFDAQGRLHFLWSDPHYSSSVESTRSTIWERVLVGGEWSPNVDITAGGAEQAINSISLAADDQGLLHLGWSEGTWSNGTHLDLDIYYRSGDGDTWAAPTRVYTSTLNSRYPLVGIDGDHPYLLWQEIDADGGSGLRGSDVYYSYLATLEPPPPLFRVYLPRMDR